MNLINKLLENFNKHNNAIYSIILTSAIIICLTPYLTLYAVMLLTVSLLLGTLTLKFLSIKEFEDDSIGLGIPNSEELSNKVNIRLFKISFIFNSVVGIFISTMLLFYVLKLTFLTNIITYSDLPLFPLMIDETTLFPIFIKVILIYITLDKLNVIYMILRIFKNASRTIVHVNVVPLDIERPFPIVFLSRGGQNSKISCDRYKVFKVDELKSCINFIPPLSVLPDHKLDFEFIGLDNDHQIHPSGDQ